MVLYGQAISGFIFNAELISHQNFRITQEYNLLKTKNKEISRKETIMSSKTETNES